MKCLTDKTVMGAGRLQWMGNMADIIILLVVLGYAMFCVYYLSKKRKSKKSCSGNCASCNSGTTLKGGINTCIHFTSKTDTNLDTSFGSNTNLTNLTNLNKFKTNISPKIIELANTKIPANTASNRISENIFAKTSGDLADKSLETLSPQASENAPDQISVTPPKQSNYLK